MVDSHFRWCNIKALPGANRLIKHLKTHAVPMALASNSSRENIEAKISFHDGWFVSGTLNCMCSIVSVCVNVRMCLSRLIFYFHAGWKDSFAVIIGGDEVRTGKPSPDM